MDFACFYPSSSGVPRATAQLLGQCGELSGWRLSPLVLCNRLTHILANPWVTLDQSRPASILLRGQRKWHQVRSSEDGIQAPAAEAFQVQEDVAEAQGLEVPGGEVEEVASAEPGEGLDR